MKIHDIVESKSENRELWDKINSKGVMPSIDRERYQARDGLEGPFRLRNGKVVYYDPQEGSYYDPDTDMYISYDDYQQMDQQGVAEGGADTSWSDDTDTITLQDILELTKHIKQINLPITDKLTNKLLHWDGNPEEMERINQVTVSKQFPILVILDEQGQIYSILDGNHRLHKAIQSGAETIPAKLIKPSDLSDKAKKILYIRKQGVAEAKTLKKRVRVVKGEHADKTGWIREIKHGTFKGAPKSFNVDLDDGGQADNLPASSLRLVKDQQGVAEGDERPKYVVTTKDKPKKIKPSMGGESPHPYQGKMVGATENTDNNLNWGSMSKRDFRRREMERELGDEDKLAKRQAQGPFHLYSGADLSSAKLIKDRDGNPMVFSNRAHAEKSAWTMSQKPFNAGKKFFIKPA